MLLFYSHDGEQYVVLYDICSTLSYHGVIWVDGGLINLILWGFTVTIELFFYTIACYS